jgi:hypothetical protein
MLLNLTIYIYDRCCWIWLSIYMVDAVEFALRDQSTVGVQLVWQNVNVYNSPCVVVCLGTMVVQCKLSTGWISPTDNGNRKCQRWVAGTCKIGILHLLLLKIMFLHRTEVQWVNSTSLHYVCFLLLQIMKYFELILCAYSDNLLHIP